MNREKCKTNLIKFGHELGQTPGDGEGQGSLVYCSPWGWDSSPGDINDLVGRHAALRTSDDNI